MNRVIIVFSIMVLLLSESNAQEFTNFTEEDGLASNNVSSISIDAEGNKWFGSYFSIWELGWGVSKFDDTNWTNYIMEDGLASNVIHSIAIDSEGNKWFVGSPCWAGPGNEYKGGGVSKFDGTNWTSYTTEDGLAGNRVFSIAIDAEDNKWFGTSNSGVSKFDGADWTTYTRPALEGYNGTSIAIDAEGNIWFGIYEGVLKYDGADWTVYYSIGLENNGVSSIAIDADDNKWIGTYGGVSKFDGANWTNYTEEDGLASNNVSSIAIDSEGNKWFGTYGGGVSKFDGSNWTTYDYEDYLVSNYVTSIAFDSEGNKWIGTMDGVSKLYNDGSVEILKPVKENSLKIYPNPVNSLLTIETDQPDHHSIEITSLNGQLIYRTEMEGNSKQIDLSPFSKGIYFVTLRSKELVVTEKIVKL